MATKLTDYYKEKLESGLYYQDFVVEKLYEIGLPLISYSSKEFQNMIGENKAGMEIKNDMNYSKTGNLFIEVAEKSNPQNAEFIPSGIYRNDNAWLYLIGDFQKIFIFSKKQLVIIHQKNKYKTLEIKTGTSKGYLLPLIDAEKFYAIKIIEC